MAVGREIRSRIRSTESTRKITCAMEMVAASKMRRAQQRMSVSKPYAEQMRRVIAHIASSRSEYQHSYLKVRPLRRIGLIIVTSDRGLCGGLNANVLRTAVNIMREWHEQNIQIDLCLIGSKAAAFFRRHGGRVVGEVSHLGDAPSVTDLIGLVNVLLNAYDETELDAVHIISNEFINTMTQKPTMLQLLPLANVSEMSSAKSTDQWDYLYEPDAKTLLDALMKRYIESQVYQAVIENIACEQAARMVAMKSASENAGELIDELKLIYNKARQAAITQELAEIIGGASAV